MSVRFRSYVRDSLVIIVGRKGHMFAQENDIPFIAFPGVEDEKRFAQAMKLRSFVTKQVLEGNIGPVKVVYAKPISLIVQKVVMLDLLPCTPHIGGDSKEPRKQVDTIMESTPEGLVEYLGYLWVGQKLFEIFGLSRLAEVAARFMHAEDSSQKIIELSEQLRLEHLRVRHEIVDQQMRELFAARAAG